MSPSTRWRTWKSPTAVACRGRSEGTAAAANSRERRREDEAAIRSAVQVDNVPVTAVAAAATRVFEEPALQQIVVECEILGLVGSARDLGFFQNP